MRLELVALVVTWVGTICLFIAIPWTAVRVTSAVLEIGEARAGRRRVVSARDSFVEPTETPSVASDELPVDRTTVIENQSDTDEPYDRGIKT